MEKVKNKSRSKCEAGCCHDCHKIIDPESVDRRKKHKLIRRHYVNPGPNFMWHIDGNDKLKPYGFAIHGCIDGFSRHKYTQFEGLYSVEF